MERTTSQIKRSGGDEVFIAVQETGASGDNIVADLPTLGIFLVMRAILLEPH